MSKELTMSSPLLLLLGLLLLITARTGARVTITRARHSPRSSATSRSACDYLSVMAAAQWTWNSAGQVSHIVSNWSGEDLAVLNTQEQLQLRWQNPNCTKEKTLLPELLLSALQHRRVLFLGDSTMSYLYRAFVKNSRLGCRPPHRMQEDRCSLARYLGVVAPHRFPHGEARFGEGPFKIGREFPGCTDCSGCTAQAQMCRARMEAEYVPMEHARDKTVTSATFQTTQDAILSHHLKEFPADVIVINVGLHAMSMCSFEGFADMFPGKAGECWAQRISRYRQDVYALLERLQEAAGLVIWLSINAINDGLQDPSRTAFSNDQSVQQFNAAVADVTKELGVPVVDVYRMSSLPFAMHELHSDPVHLHNRGDLYYTELAGVVAQAIVETYVSKGNTTK